MYERSIRSFVLRQGRLTTGQARALSQHWHYYGIDYAPERLNLNDIFQRSSPKILDIGSGMGETLVRLANLNQGNDYLGIEVHRPGVGCLIRQAVENNLGNIRIINHDVVEVLKYQIPENSLDQVYLFFPDPWPKKRHHKRRLVSPDFLALLVPKLKSNARLFLATDWQDLAEYMLHICDHDPALVNLAGSGNFAPRPAWRPITKFEHRGRSMDHKVWDLCYCPRF
jgi:tRNA (guanine-N7-)-methyltransferase